VLITILKWKNDRIFSVDLSHNTLDISMRHDLIVKTWLRQEPADTNTSFSTNN